MFSRIFDVHRSPFVVVFLAFVATACGEDPVEPDDHAHVDALVILVDGQPAVTVEEGEIEGAIVLAEGGEAAVTVQFMDHDGEPVTLDASENYLRVTIANEAVAHFHQQGPFSGELHGEAAGETTATFSLMHGNFSSGSGHPDAEFRNVPIVVQ